MALLLLSARNRWHFFSGVSGKDFDTVSLLQSRLKSARTMQNGALLVIISELVAPSLGGQKRLFQRVSTWKCGYFLIRFLLSFWFACAAIIKATHASFASKVRLNLQEAKNNELDPLVTITEPVVFLFGGQMRICQRIARMWSLFHSFFMFGSLCRHQIYARQFCRRRRIARCILPPKSAKIFKNNGALVIVAESEAPSFGGQRRTFQRVSRWRSFVR